MNNITLRPPGANEHLLIRQMIARNNLNPFGLAWENFTVAADQDDKLIGCGQIKHHGELEELASLVVTDEWQGRGISTLLMNALLERSARPLWLMCESPLTSYYNRFGFREVENPDELPAYFRNVFWGSRITFGLLFFFRGTHMAIMVRES
jgi:N-acetylglutamate synthase-like GNAT family acetyltransferase